MDRSLDRRGFCRQVLAAACGAAALALGARPASALQIEENANREQLLLSACESAASHRQQIDELLKQIEGDSVVSAEVRAANRERVAALKCPTCGCALGAVQPYPARF